MTAPVGSEDSQQFSHQQAEILSLEQRLRQCRPRSSASILSVLFWNRPLMWSGILIFNLFVNLGDVFLMPYVLTQLGSNSILDNSVKYLIVPLIYLFIWKAAVILRLLLTEKFRLHMSASFVQCMYNSAFMVPLKFICEQAVCSQCMEKFAQCSEKHTAPKESISGSAALQNVLGEDTYIAVSCLLDILEFSAFPVGIACSLLLLFNTHTGISVSPAYGIGLLLVLAFVFVNLCRKLIFNQTGLRLATELRVQRVKAMLHQYYPMKMHMWECLFAKRILMHRMVELHHIAKIFWIRSIDNSLQHLLPVFVLIYGLYQEGNSKSVSVAQVMIITATVRSICRYASGLSKLTTSLSDLKISLRRLNKFISMAKCEKENRDGVRSPPDTPLEIGMPLESKRNQCIGVTGPTGSGKTLFFLYLLGEFPKTQMKSKADREIRQLLSLGKKIRKSHSVAYISQKPWFFPGTVRENIVMGKQYKKIFYEKVVFGCGLHIDFLSLLDGDLTVIEKNGQNLSGGQRSRIALARAVYQRKQFYLLDAPFAALDPNTTQHILDNCIFGVLSGTVRLIITANESVLAKCEKIICFDQSKVSIVENNYLNRWSNAEEKVVNRETYPEMVPKVLPESEKKETRKDGFILQKDHEKTEKLFTQYWQSLPFLLRTAFLATASLHFFLGFFSDLWLAKWNGASLNYENGTDTIRTGIRSEKSSESVSAYRIYCAIFGTSHLLGAVAYPLYFLGTYYSGKYLNGYLTNSVMRCTPHSLFSKRTTTGKILTHFGMDTTMCDLSLPATSFAYLWQCGNTAISLFTVFYLQPNLAVLLIPVLAIVLGSAKSVQKSIRHMKQQVTDAWIPVYSVQNATADPEGLATLRSSGFESCTYFKLKMLNCVADLMRSEFRLTRFIAIIQSVFLIFESLIIFAVVTTGFYTDISRAKIIIVLLHCIEATDNIRCLFESRLEAEKAVVHYHRVISFVKDLEKEPSEKLATANIPIGQIEFSHFYAAYGKHGDATLHDISVKIPPGQLTAVVGRTGSGKSSLVLALYRLLASRSGYILLDQRDIDHLDTRSLRSQMAVLSQVPTMFDGSLRHNLDPMGKHSDAQLQVAVKVCNLEKVIRRLGSLDASVGSEGALLFTGEQQLVAFGRMLLQNRPINILDEFTANVDPITEKFLLKQVIQLFQGKTVLLITHKLDVAVLCKEVVVMDRGRVVETGNPRRLLAKKSSRFSSLFLNL
ncbi:multidrug resistance protein mrp-7-like isoform X2 [Paramacrobiotus metropolitanus]|uniref:multidrug resistance protein mrp-7-like isoform X2 n=1 Tax=Paramacrobiotus metropolitanus TaxID=2943436 RepID=UPI002445DD96|nr:multidrug resistance protein mrp-7-like isoform X2 [Paramacrobiotus metropolitanus]